MAAHTFTLSELEEKALEWYVTSHINPTQNPPFKDVAAYIAARVDQLVAPVVQAYNEADRAEFIERYDLGTLAERAAAKAVLPKKPEPPKPTQPEPVREGGLIVSRQ